MAIRHKISFFLLFLIDTCKIPKCDKLWGNLQKNCLKYDLQLNCWMFWVIKFNFGRLDQFFKRIIHGNRWIHMPMTGFFTPQSQSTSEIIINIVQNDFCFEIARKILFLMYIISAAASTIHLTHKNLLILIEEEGNLA